MLIDYFLPSPSGEDEPWTIAIGGRAKNLRIPLMWDAYIQAGGLLKVDETKEKTVKSPERPLECELANLQVRTLLSKSLLVPAGTHIFSMCVARFCPDAYPPCGWAIYPSAPSAGTCNTTTAPNSTKQPPAFIKSGPNRSLSSQGAAHPSISATGVTTRRRSRNPALAY
jgi:hypothetical protein